MNGVDIARTFNSCSLRFALFLKRKTEKKGKKKEKGKQFFRGRSRLSRFLQQKILPEQVEIFFAKPVGLDLYCL